MPLPAVRIVRGLALMLFAVALGLAARGAAVAAAFGAPAGALCLALRLRWSSVVHHLEPAGVALALRPEHGGRVLRLRGRGD
eukprot:8147510-Pyramimonas_sp.AAC.1